MDQGTTYHPSSHPPPIPVPIDSQLLPPIHRRQVRPPQPNSRDASPPSIPSSTTSFGASPPPSTPPAGPRPVPEDIQFALEALHNLTTYCPDLARRLDELSGQIDQRQLDLAHFAEQHSQDPRRTASHRSPRDRPSTESLKPRDDADAHPAPADREHGTDEPNAVQRPDDKRASAVTDGLPPPAPRTPGRTNLDANAPASAVEPQTPQATATATASATARANLRRSQLNRKRAAAAESVLTGDGAVATKYRNRNLVIVYYDSYVQSFFEEVVKFVSASRNLMRKAKMAAKVAQIKRMAELEMPDDDDDDDDDDESGSDEAFGLTSDTAAFAPARLSPSTALQPDGPLGRTAETKQEKGNAAAGEKTRVSQPTAAAKAERMLAAINSNRLSYIRADGNKTGIASDKDLSPSSPKLSTPIRPSTGWSSSFSTYGAGSDPRQPPDVFDELDKGLEAVQSMCEHAAHQFLRDGDCADDIVKIKERLTGTKASADKELERRLLDDPDGSLKKLLADGPPRSRTHGPQSMRRDASLAGAAARLKTSFAGGMAGGTNGAGACAGVIPAPGPDSKAALAGAGALADAMMLEVDEGNGGADLDAETPKFQFRSTRAMGPRAVAGS